MATSNRSTQFVKIHKVLKKHYTPMAPGLERPVLEHLLFACCLEDARYEQAEEALASVVETFFDWNEIRVSTVRELAESMARLPDPPAAATRLKKTLQHVFEDAYAFDLEALRKKNLGPAEEELGKSDGVSPFMVAYAVQSALGGHSIPLDAGTTRVFEVLGLISEKDIKAGVVPGLERAIPKNKGIEFGSLLHQLGADMTDDPFSDKLHKILLEIDPECEARLPRRLKKKKKPAKAQRDPADKKAGKKTAPRKAAAPKAKKKAAVRKKPASTAKPPKAKPAKKKIAVSRKADGPAPAKKKAASKISKRKPR